MASENDKEIIDMLLRIERLEAQQKRFASDAESEKMVRRDRNKGFDNEMREHDKRIRSLEDFKNSAHGSWIVSKILLAVAATVLSGVLIWWLTK